MINISVYSGKCDFYDSCSIHGADEIIKKYNIYAYDNEVIPLKIETEKDLVPYYPYLVRMMSGGSENGGCIYLSKESFVDSEEQECLRWRLDDLKMYWRRCKRKKVPFDRREAERLAVGWRGYPENFELELVNRVEKDGEKATLDGIHTPMHESYRQELYDEMVKFEYSEDIAYRWCFGWKRWLEKKAEGKNDKRRN